MAGNYPDVPSWRMPIDRDGTTGVYIATDGTLSTFTSTQMQQINDESSSSSHSGSGAGQHTYCLVFPEARDLDAYYIGVASGGAVTVQVSANTTNGFDGTWTQINSYTPPSGDPKPGYRSNIISTTQLGIRGIRVSVSVGVVLGVAAALFTFHVYGENVPGSNPHKLELWHPTLNQRLSPAALDWGDTPRSSSEDRTFRVKNISPTLTGNSVRVAMDILTDGSPSVVAQHTLSLDGSTFFAQVNVGNLAPGAISALVTIRRSTPANAQLSLFSFRVFAEANTWS